MESSLVEIHALSKYFPSQKIPALEKIQASIPKGKITGLIGPDGSGKTTLIRLMAGLLKPTEGYISVNGYDTIKESEYVHYLTGYMPQKFGLYEDLTVRQNLNLYAELRNVLGEERKQTFEKLLDFTSLGDCQDRLAKNLSGGMKQKLGLACALIKKPMFLLLDEPSVGVDPVSRRELWNMITSLIQEGISVLWSTAYLDEAEKCDYVFLLNHGKLLYEGSPKELTSQIDGRVVLVPSNHKDKRQLLRRFLKDENVMDGVIQGSHLRLLLKDPNIQFKETSVYKTKPRFEDAFIHILGGGPGGESKLADESPPVQSEVLASIRAECLTKKFGQYTAVDQLSLEVKKGEVFGLLGPNGAGKTTTFKMLCGLLRPTSGKALVNEIDFQKAPSAARERIGYMAQKFSLYGHLSVKQNLEFFAGIYQLRNKRKKEAIEKMTEIFNLETYLATTAEALPLGYKQRLSLACANMHHPDVLFLDEPTSGVDPMTRREFWNHINGLVDKGVTILITTHFMDEAEYCDRVALIYRGKIIKLDTPEGLKNEIRSQDNDNPTLEDVFIKVLENK